MVVLIACLGISVGSMLAWVSDVLPRLSSNIRSKDSLPRPRLALWTALRARQSRWGWLQVGMEITSGLAFALLWTQFELTWRMGFFMVSFVLLMLIAVIDIKYRLVLNIVVYPTVIIVIIFQEIFFSQDTLNVFVGGAMTFGIFFLTAWLKPGQLGCGDIKLATLIGLTFGFPQVLWALLIGAGLGGLAAAYLLFVERRNSTFTIPYAPFLCFGAMIALLYNPFMTLG